MGDLFPIIAEFTELNDRNFDLLLIPQLQPVEQLINKELTGTKGSLRAPGLGVRYDGFIIDLSQVQFANPYGALGVVCLSEFLYSRFGWRVQVWLPEKRSVWLWMDHLGLLHEIESTADMTYRGRPVHPKPPHQPGKDSYLSVLKICTKQGTYFALAEVVTRFVPMLIHHLGYDAKAAYQCGTVVTELCQNIYDHSAPEGMGKGYAVAQVYPKRLDLAVMDFGLGIPATLRRRYPGLSDRELICMAFESKTTSRSKARGLGLCRTADIVEQAGGTLNVRSGNAKVFLSPKNGYRLSRRRGSGRGVQSKGVPDQGIHQEGLFQGWGTQIGISLPIRQLPS